MKNPIIVRNLTLSINCYLISFLILVFLESHCLYHYMNDVYGQEAFFKSFVINTIIIFFIGKIYGNYIRYRHNKLGIY